MRTPGTTGCRPNSEPSWPVDFRCSRLRRLRQKLLAPIEYRRPWIDDGPNVADESRQVGKAHPPCDPDGGGSKISGRSLVTDDSSDHDEHQRSDRKQLHDEPDRSAGDGVADLPAKRDRTAQELRRMHSSERRSRRSGRTTAPSTPRRRSKASGEAEGRSADRSRAHMRASRRVRIARPEARRGRRGIGVTTVATRRRAACSG